MLETMNQHWAAGEVEEAVALAKAAAPYVHPRAQHGRAVDLQECDDDELGRRAGASVAGGAAGEL